MSNRRDFLKQSALLSLVAGFGSSVISTSQAANFNGDVIIIGAGAAGMTAAHHLKRAGIDATILEASNRFGGRMKTNHAFADFPIAMGAEWLHTKPRVFGKIAPNKPVIRTAGYSGKEEAIWIEDGKAETYQIGATKDRVFVNYSWQDFFNDHILPPIASQIRYNQVVNKVDRLGKRVLITTQAGQTYEADKVIFTASLRMLQKASVEFTPPLSSKKTKRNQKSPGLGWAKNVLLIFRKVLSVVCRI